MVPTSNWPARVELTPERIVITKLHQPQEVKLNTGGRNAANQI
jgi:hypothetical protein